MNKYATLDAFLTRIRADIYPEPASEPHGTITRKMIEKLVDTGIVTPGSRVLDVGCGSGLALEAFARFGVQAVGVTLGPELEPCREKGLDVREMDFSFLQFDADSFDLIWCRHTLEHSFSPIFTLYGFHGILKSNGRVYVEVPAPDTACHHEANPNHYFVPGKSMWQSLFQKSGFVLEWTGDFSFDTPMGPDLYWSFILRKKTTP
ncbi:MAG: methyltransferase domain-containing protein [Magnetococcales bacterium]|nr:methyltransferase domain-containing protein [Magnetococcales bacterium]